jgi:hypothetical protein
MSDKQSQPQPQPDGSRRIEFETKPVSETVKINWVVQDLRGMLELLQTGAATAADLMKKLKIQFTAGSDVRI